MKNITRLITLLAVTTALLAATSSVALGASTLVYSDEFNGPLDTATWANRTPWNTRSPGLAELAYYDANNCTFANGTMTLKSENRAISTYSYASGIVSSLNRTRFSYGYFEIRAQLPKGPGIWPAFWLTNDSTLEIDVLEMLGDRPSRLYQTLHKNGSQVYQKVWDGPDYSAGYHTYAVDWQPTYIKWYVDGQLTTTYTGAIPSDPMMICLNTAVGGAWPGAPTAATTFPVNYDIDYVRVYDSKPVAAAPPVVNTAPVANADAYATANTTKLTVSAPGLLGNDTDADANTLSASTVTLPAHGTLSLSANGSFTYTPTAGFSGVDSFTYRVSDGTAYSSAATVSITVAAAIVAPPVVAPTTPVPTIVHKARPVYRFLNRTTDVHFYTGSEEEKLAVTQTLSSTYSLEGVAYTLDTASAANTAPLYRFYNLKKGVHFYTASEAEKNRLIDSLSSVYRYDGIAYNVSLTPNGAQPVYRFYNANQGVHFFTADAAERDNLVAHSASTYQYEGIAYYYAASK